MERTNKKDVNKTNAFSKIGKNLGFWKANN